MGPGVMMDVGYGPLQRDTPVAEAPATDRAGDGAPDWFLRASTGLGSVPNSAQNELFETNGYDQSGVRWHHVADGAAFLWPHVGLGGFLGYSWRRVDPEYGGPELEEDVFRIGVQVPVTAGSPAYRFLLAPRLGLVHGSQSLHGDGDYVTGPLLGLSAGLVFPKLHFGFQLGGYYAPVPAAGDLGEREDFGGVDLMISVYFDG